MILGKLQLCFNHDLVKFFQYNIIKDAYFVENSDSLGKIYKSRNDSFLVGSFSSSVGSSNKPQNESAICVYSLSQIEELFSANIHNCFNGSMHHRNMEYISGPIHEGKCPKSGSVGNIHNLCEIGLKISGITPIKSEPYQTLSQSVTSVFYKELDGANGVLIAGTASGRLLVILTSVTSSAKLLTNYQLSERNAVTKVYLLDNDIIALQSHTVSKLRASNCEDTYRTCSSCMTSKDPFCGWCSFRNKCTHHSDCKPHKNLSQWLSNNAGQCSQVQKITPSSISLPTAIAAATTSLIGKIQLN